MLKRFAFFLAIGGLGFLLSTCEKPTLIGDELLEDDRIGIQKKDSLDVQAGPYIRDSFLVYNPNVDGQRGLSLYPLGKMNDSEMGLFDGSIYAQFRSFQIEVPITDTPRLDSVILSLEYDSTGFYGPRDQMQSVSVYRVEEDMERDQRHYSFDEFQTGELLGSKDPFIPEPAKPFVGIDYASSPPDTFVQSPQIRMHLNESFGNYILGLDSLTLSTGDEFIKALNGLHIKATQETNSLMGINLYGGATGLRVYYNENDSSKLMSFAISTLSSLVSNQKHDYSGAPIGPYIEESQDYDSLAYVQSLSGPEIKITLPEFNVTNDVLINQARLTITLKPQSEEMEEQYPPIDQMAIASGSNMGSPVYIEDVILSIQSNLNRIFGGTLEERTIGGEQVLQYEMNLAGHYQDIVEGTAFRELIITPRPKVSRPFRSVVYGPTHSKYPMTFRIVYTEESE